MVFCTLVVIMGGKPVWRMHICGILGKPPSCGKLDDPSHSLFLFVNLSSRVASTPLNFISSALAVTSYYISPEYPEYVPRVCFSLFLPQFCLNGSGGFFKKKNSRCASISALVTPSSSQSWVFLTRPWSRLGWVSCCELRLVGRCRWGSSGLALVDLARFSIMAAAEGFSRTVPACFDFWISGSFFCSSFVFSFTILLLLLSTSFLLLLGFGRGGAVPSALVWWIWSGWYFSCALWIPWQVFLSRRWSRCLIGDLSSP